MIVYHGSDCTVSKPDVSRSERLLDFGCGFYVTTVKAQAERWAKRKAVLNGSAKAVVNTFEWSESQDFKVLDFGNDLGKR